MLWNGAPNDALGLVDSHVLTQVELRRVTQRALWYFTDGYTALEYLDGNDDSSKLYRQLTHRQIEGDEFATIGDNVALAPKAYPAGSVLYVYTPTAESNEYAQRREHKDWQNLLGAYFRHEDTRVIITPNDEPNPTPRSGGQHSFIVAKVDADTKEELPGAELQIRALTKDSTINGLAGAQTHGWTSEVTRKRLTVTPGDYILTETKAPEGYELPDSREPLALITVHENGEVSLGEDHSPLVFQDGTTILLSNKARQSKPTLNTNAYDKATGESDSTLPSSGGVIADKLTYTGLVPGREYEVRGQLMDKATGQPVGVEKRATFKADAAQGEYFMDFEVPSLLAGKSLVVFETIYEKTDQEITDETPFLVKHADLNSASQTVLVDAWRLPGMLETQASTANGNILPAEGGIVTDTVTYSNLEPNHFYTLRGELMDKATGTSTGIKAEKKFFVNTESGEESLDFTVGPEWAGHDLVVFEKLIDVDNEEAATHEDLGAASQTIMVESEKEGHGWIVPLVIGGALIGGALLAGSAASSGSSGSSTPTSGVAPAPAAATGVNAPASEKAEATTAPAARARLATTGASVLGILAISLALIIGGVLVIIRCRKS